MVSPRGQPSALTFLPKYGEYGLQESLPSLKPDFGRSLNGRLERLYERLTIICSRAALNECSSDSSSEQNSPVPSGCRSFANFSIVRSSVVARRASKFATTPLS